MTLSDFAPVEGCPELRMVDHQWLEEQACEGRKCRVLGWYPGSGDVIYLDESLDLQRTFDASVALHEIVHWVQGRAGRLAADCSTALSAERQAYYIQREYLVSYGSAYPAINGMHRLWCDSQQP